MEKDLVLLDTAEVILFDKETGKEVFKGQVQGISLSEMKNNKENEKVLD